ncbi:hypothetical protein H2198_000272 [Neophaeococcomyces mojaviensis]|uniref:Uncharacterized protein n=1 Tax=Neophaeococcomyces mojaviensis TaxID=3383035 RepID=A0ACC3AK56_9EURO|nr:hypothetical protein H2198_000272 [Knufia sp. JES_112]
MAERGRGTSRHSQPSSRAASAASSHGSMQGRITLGSTDLSRITQSMDTVVRQMQTRYQQIEQLIEQGVADDREGYGNTNAAADREIERTKKLLRELDRLDEEMEKARRVCAVVRGLKAKVDAASDRLDRAITIQVSTPRPPTRPR